jgi:hypothetical protein
VAVQPDTAGTFAVSSTTTAELEVRAPGERRYTIGPVARGRTSCDLRQLAGTNRPQTLGAATQLPPALSIRRERGRTTLGNGRLIETVGAARTEITLDPSSLAQVARDRFGTVLDRPTLSALQGRWRSPAY